MPGCKEGRKSRQLLAAGATGWCKGLEASLPCALVVGVVGEGTWAREGSHQLCDSVRSPVLPSPSLIAFCSVPLCCS